jgi:hypothetical protein
MQCNAMALGKPSLFPPTESPRLLAYGCAFGALASRLALLLTSLGMSAAMHCLGATAWLRGFSVPAFLGVYAVKSKATSPAT